MASALQAPVKDPRQLPWRSIGAGLALAALVAAVLLYGLWRRDALLDRRRADLLEGVERLLEALASSGGDPKGAQPLREAGRIVAVGRDGGEFALRSVDAWAAIARGERSVSVDGQWWIAAQDDDDYLVAVVPEAALMERLAGDRRELSVLLWTAGGALLVTSFAMAWFVRRRLWDFRARETAQYVVAIRREGAKWRALTESAADMILIVDARDGAEEERNKAALATLGHASLRECVDAADYEELARGLVAARERPGEPIALRELKVRARDGRELRVDVRLSGIDLGDEHVIELSLRDVTRERGMERQLAISERLSSLGLLTAGVAHEINNPLEGIGNYLTLLAREDVPTEKRGRYVEQVRAGFERIRTIVRDLLAFARPGVEHGEAELGEVVERVRALCAYTKSFGEVAVEVAGLDAPLVVPLDRGRLEQVLLNLLLNAATAMGGRGRILVRAERDVRDVHGERCVRITVDDEGPGIAPEQLSSIFDPFFTTTQGNGLGLSISFGLVRAHGGSLVASNRPEGGARLVVELPAMRARK
ncbi:MAG: PAS domain S-box protein [Planctomycetes bacterium]|nr:PAS domain S-box protein [Planctomycetota bacterium]